MLFEKVKANSKGRVRRASLRPKTTDLMLFPRVEITAVALTILSKHRQLRGENEAGGILIGTRYPDLLRIERVTEPGTDDRCGPTFFERDAAAAQHAINEAWKTSGGTQIYLGEWHTHPETYPTPSGRDRKMIADMFEGSQPRHGPLILLIVGTRGLWLGCQGSTLDPYQISNRSLKVNTETESI